MISGASSTISFTGRLAGVWTIVSGPVRVNRSCNVNVPSEPRKLRLGVKFVVSTTSVSPSQCPRASPAYDRMLAGARACDALTRLPEIRSNPAALLALMWHHAGGGRGARDMVVLPYKDRLELFSKYLQQLIMESLGKEHDLAGRQVFQGLTVYGNKGSTDQHAYVQQLRDGDVVPGQRREVRSDLGKRQRLDALDLELGGSEVRGAHYLVECLARREVVAHRADAAEPLHHHRHFPIRSALDEFFEAAEFVDVHVSAIHRAIFFHVDGHFGMTFNAGDGFNRYFLCAHGVIPLY